MEYTIVDHIKTMNRSEKSINELRDYVDFRRKFSMTYFMGFMMPMKSFTRYETNDGFPVKVMGLEPDHERARREMEVKVLSAPESMRSVFTAEEVYEKTGVIVDQNLWGSKLRELEELEKELKIQ